MQTTIGGFLFLPKPLTKEMKFKAAVIFLAWARCKVGGIKLQESVKAKLLKQWDLSTKRAKWANKVPPLEG